MSDPQPPQGHVQTLVHKGEVLVIWPPGTPFLTFSPAQARSMAQSFITCALAAENTEKPPEGTVRQ